MRETDLLAFEIALKESGAGAVMCSYNRVEGDYACENSYLLNDVLKKSWGFRGFVVSDWFATNSTVKAALAGHICRCAAYPNIVAAIRDISEGTSR